MPFYQQRGSIPRKRHTVFPRTGGGIHYEELIGNEGFTGASSLLYRLHRPTQLLGAEVVREEQWEEIDDRALRPRHLRMGGMDQGGSAVLDRTPLLFNGDVAIGMVRPRGPEPSFYRNGQGDELVYVARGKGILETAFGNLPFGDGDYLVIPRGIVHHYRFDAEDTLLLVVESRGVLRIPRRYRNENGQCLEGAPYSERDFRSPKAPVARDEVGEFVIHTKQRNVITAHTQRTHPFDVVGWDGTYYPWAFNISNFEALVGRIHQPPPVHQTFGGEGFVVCSFVPRLYDFDEKAIPAPYNHTNAQSDEMIFYAAEEFMSRKGIEFGSITLHPDGLPHGPHPGKTEESIGRKETNELAVMVDTFRPLRVARASQPFDDSGYLTSWNE